MKTQLFSPYEAEGKTVDDIMERNSHLIIYFTDNTFIVYNAYACDGWHGEGAQEIETDNYEVEYGK